MQVDTDSLGSYLRRERELRERSLPDISAATKIQLKFLEALEQDDYDKLPPAPFVVGFLRAYAQCLSLEPEEIIAAYHTRHSSSEGVNGPTLVAYQVGRPTRSRLVGVSLLVVAVAVVMGVALQFLMREAPNDPTTSVGSGVGESPSDTSRPVVETSPVALSKSPPQPVEPVLPLAQVSGAPIQEGRQEQRLVTSLPPVPAGLESPRAASVAHPPADPPSRLLTLQAVALEDTWLRVEVDGNKRYALLLASGKATQWEGQERFVLTIGNARGTRLTLNGKDISLPPSRSNVVRDFQVTRKFVD